MKPKDVITTTPLDHYANITAQRQDAFLKASRGSGPFYIGPTNRGGIFFKYKNKDISEDFSIQDLKDMRDLIQDFLTNVVGIGE